MKFGLAILLFFASLAVSFPANASGQFDGEWSSSSATSVAHQCGPGSVTLTVRDNDVTGVTERLALPAFRDFKETDKFFADTRAAVSGKLELLVLANLRNFKEADKAMADHRTSASDITSMTVITFGDGSLVIGGRIKIVGSVRKDGAFAGTIDGQVFTGEFKRDRFQGGLSPGVCATTVVLKRAVPATKAK